MWVPGYFDIPCSFEIFMLPASHTSVPVLETERLILRGHKVDDFADSFALWSDPGVARFITGKPSTREESWSRLLRYAGHWSLMGFGYWLVAEKATGRFVGEVGFVDLKREIDPSMEGMPEAGWVLSPQVHGKGYATEAVRAAIGWGERHFGGAPMVCIVSPENEASLRVAERCGFRPVQETTYKDHAVIMFRRDGKAA